MLGVLPAIASAGGRFGTDRGARYSGHSHSSSSWGVGVSFGYAGGGSYYGGTGFYGAGHYGYGYHGGYSCYSPGYYPGYCAPVYRPVVYAPPVVYTPPVYYYAAPTYYAAPAPVYAAPAVQAPGYYSGVSVYYYNR
jgi:hypothetical protein